MHISSEEEGSNESKDDPDSDADNDNEYDRENEDVCITVARENIEHARDKMCKKHDKKSKVINFAIGDIAVVKLPRDTRTATDQRKLFCKVIGCQYTPPRYKIQTKFGIIDRFFPTSQLAPVPRSVADAIEIGNIRKEITLSQAANFNSSGERVIISCQCRGNCVSKRCRCFKNGVKCSVHCHREEYNCGWMKPLTERTEHNLIDNDARQVDLVEGGIEQEEETSPHRRGKAREGKRKAIANTKVGSKRRRANTAGAKG